MSLNPEEIPNTFYRLSAKALIFNDTQTEFAIIREDNDLWDLPGGGLDFNEDVSGCLKREIKEEMGLTVTDINEKLIHYLIGRNMDNFWAVGLVFEVKVNDLNFIPTDECRELRFVSPDEALAMPTAWRTVKELAAFLKSK
jgi:8-oxo-dGTP diphosphatase